jgi:hypothetical protein
VITPADDRRAIHCALHDPTADNLTVPLATKLLVTDEGERGTELFVLDNRRLRDLANFAKGSIRQFNAAVTDRQPAVGDLAASRQAISLRQSHRRPAG